MRKLDAAQRLGVSTATLKRFLLQDSRYHGYLLKRTPGGHYRFTEEDVRRLDYAMTQAGMQRHPERVMFQQRGRGQSRRMRRW
ncbi:MAG: hypothetical protein A3G93_08480 [Nitrospinae bacterium RIFCSPLOWO2_12_FULL_45_22]|nr:MAG: hypothetical protein A3G93_08480 [Nitrospinae bacterium RIFCSPLOWO2_12_FULL_45_22]